MYSVADLLEEGKLKEANALSLKIPAARGELAPSYYIYMARDSITRVNPRLPVALRTGNWTQVLRLLQASQLPDGEPISISSRGSLPGSQPGCRPPKRIIGTGRNPRRCTLMRRSGAHARKCKAYAETKGWARSRRLLRIRLRYK